MPSLKERDETFESVDKLSLYVREELGGDSSCEEAD